MKNSILNVKNLSKTYHNEKQEVLALKDINFNVQDKEFISIVGPSGCGKSTILTILANILPKSKGEITFNIDNPKFGYMLQEDSLFPWRTVLENACLGLEIKKELTSENKQKVINLLNKYGLKEFINSYPADVAHRTLGRGILAFVNVTANRTYPLLHNHYLHIFIIR